MFINNINPTLSTLFGLEIRIYGIIFALSILIVYYYLKKVEHFKEEQAEELILYTLISMLFFARLFEILFYNLSFYLNNPLEMFMIWKGGLSFHGGLIGTAIGIYIYAKKNKTKFLEITDIMLIPISFCLALGRFANFTNHELVGKITSIPWAVKFNNYEGYRHPTQIYESFKNLLIFTILISIKKYKKLRTGVITALFLIFYSILRFFIEFLKEPIPNKLYFNLLNTSQILCIFMLFLGIYVLVYSKDT